MVLKLHPHPNPRETGLNYLDQQLAWNETPREKLLYGEGEPRPRHSHSNYCSSLLTLPVTQGSRNGPDSLEWTWVRQCTQAAFGDISLVPHLKVRTQINRSFLRKREKSRLQNVYANSRVSQDQEGGSKFFMGHRYYLR